MTIQILMPALSPTMTEGTLAKWLKAKGDTIKAGDVLAEIETDKATMEFEAVDEGELGEILIPAGTSGIAVNTPIAIMLEEGEDASALSGATKPAAPAALPPVSALPASQPASAQLSTPNVDHGERVFATPLARRIAAQGGLDIARVKGSGPNGRVVKADVEAALANPSALVMAPPAPSPAPASTGGPAPAAPAVPASAVSMPRGVDAKDLADKLGMTYTAVPNSGVRKTIAKRLTEAKQTVPHFYLTIDCELDELLAIRARLNTRTEGLKLSVNDFLIRAVAIALNKVPAANAAYTDDAILIFDHADISVAVATPAGLITPIVKSAETKGLAAISSEMRDLASRAREGKLRPEEFQGGTFTISNLGMFGIKEFKAIINPPQGCILAVGAGERRPVVKDGALAIATVMTVTLSVDHRVVDGAVGAEFLAQFKKLVEDPLSMLL